MRSIGVLTTSRAEYSILRPVLKAITADENLRLLLFVGGAHLSPEFGSTERQLEYPITERVESLMSSDTEQGIGMSYGLTVMGFAQAFARTRPDILLITGDRFEAAAVASAAQPFKIPIAHLGGGDITLGAFDENYRHAITKMSHLHFCYAESQARRVVQMGEDPTKVFITGNPALDDLDGFDGVPPADEAIVVIFHPVTLEYERTNEYTNNLLTALHGWEQPVVFILPNADTFGRNIRRSMRTFPGAQVHSNLVPGVFHNLLRHAVCLVGNSSCGLMEAPSFELPAVNIGTRQEGRLRGANVIDVGYTVEEIRRGIDLAIDPLFREKLRGMVNPYGDGHSAPRIDQHLKEASLDVEKKWFPL